MSRPASTLQHPEVAAHERLMQQIPGAWGDWLAGEFAWHHFVTLTFAFQPSPERAVRQFSRWIRRLEQRAQRRVGWVRALERSPAGLLHLHVLTTNTADLAPAALEHAWPCGRVDASIYDRTKGAAHYITKDFGARIVDYDVASPAACNRHSVRRSLNRA